jgi:hypothetical protein
MRDSLGGKRGAGPPLEPDEQAYIEIGQAFVLNDEGSTGPKVDDLTDSEILKIEDEIMQHILDAAADHAED